MVSQKKFPPLRSKSVGAIVWSLIMLLVVLVIIPLVSNSGAHKNAWLGIVLTLPLLLLLLWAWFGTYYKVDVFFLRYYVGPFRGRIPVAAIRNIEYQHKPWSGTLIALASNGLLIRYNQQDEVYVAPRNKAGFICELQKYNPHIKVILANGQPE